MKVLRKLLLNIHSVYSFFIFNFRGLAILGRINTRVYTKLLTQYKTVQKCAVPTKPIFHHLEQIKVKFFEKKGVLEAPWMVYTTVSRTKLFESP